MRALVVDDSSTIRLLLRKILSDLGFEVMEAANGLEALACLNRSKTVQLVLVDWVMPVMDGCEFLSRVRSDPSLRDVVLVMVTEKGDVDHVLQALKAGADEYVIKPFDERIISEKLKIVGFLPS